LIEIKLTEIMSAGGKRRGAGRPRGSRALTLIAPTGERMSFHEAARLRAVLNDDRWNDRKFVHCHDALPTFDVSIPSKDCAQKRRESKAGLAELV
jgi:hypothetical protein